MIIFAKPWDYLWGSWHWHYSFCRARGRRLTSGRTQNLDGLARLNEGKCQGRLLQFPRMTCCEPYYCNLGEFKCLFLQKFLFEVKLKQQVDCTHNIKPFSLVWGGRKLFRHGWVASWECLTAYTLPLQQHQKTITFKQLCCSTLGLRVEVRSATTACCDAKRVPPPALACGSTDSSWNTSPIYAKTNGVFSFLCLIFGSWWFRKHTKYRFCWGLEQRFLSALERHLSAFKNTHSSFCRVKPPWTLDVYQIHIDLHIVDSPLLCFWFFLFLRLFFSLVHSSPLCGQTSGYIFLCGRVLDIDHVGPVAARFHCLLPCCRHRLPVLDLMACYFSFLLWEEVWGCVWIRCFTCFYPMSQYQVSRLSGSSLPICDKNSLKQNINLGKCARKCPAFWNVWGTMAWLIFLHAIGRTHFFWERNAWPLLSRHTLLNRRFPIEATCVWQSSRTFLVLAVRLAVRLAKFDSIHGIRSVPVVLARANHFVAAVHLAFQTTHIYIYT